MPSATSPARPPGWAHPVRREQRPGAAARGVRGRPVPAHARRHGADRAGPRARRPVGAALDAVRAAVELNRPVRARDRARGVRDRRVRLCRVRPRPRRWWPRCASGRPGSRSCSAMPTGRCALALLDEDRAHLALGIFPEPPARMTRIVLMRDEFVVLMRPDHPAAAARSRRLPRRPHLLVSPVASREGAVDRALGGRLRSIVGIGSSSAAMMRLPAGLVSLRSGRRSRARAATSIRSGLQDPASVAALPCPDRLAAFRGGTTCPHRNPRAAHVGSLRRTGCAKGMPV